MGAAPPEGETPHPQGLLPEQISTSRETPLSAYVHVPFCSVRCGYCDFNTYTAEELRGERREDYASRVAREIVLADNVLRKVGESRSLDTVFYGGGTPTLLPAEDIVFLLENLRTTFGINPGAEITVEANPDTMEGDVAQRLAEGGVTRISMGMQSAVPHVLRTLDRTHHPENVARAVEIARKAGLAVSVDLIYGTPGESLEDWRTSVRAALDLGVDHVSAYALIVEEGTALARQISRGDVAPVDDDVQADMYELADEMFTQAGLEWYELSNWARSPQTQSQHNLAYWRNDDWWGFGPGAHSHIAGARFWNVRHPAAYADRLLQGLSPAQGIEIPDSEARDLESIMLGIRLAEGLKTDGFDGGTVATLMAEGLVNDEAARRGQLVLTRAGRLRADDVTRRLAAR